MKNLSIYFVFMVFVFSSCKVDVVEKPENLIPKEKMVDIFYDIAILNAAKGTSSEILQKNNILPEKYIYDKYEIDSLQLAQSSIYYASLPDTHIQIFKQVEEKLKMIKEEVEKERKKKDSELRKELSKPKKDSLKINGVN